MSAFGPKRTLPRCRTMSAFRGKAEIVIATANVRAGMRLAYCRGGIGVRDDGGAIGARKDGGTGVGLRAGATDGCAGDSGIFAINSATAASNRAISRAICS